MHTVVHNCLCHVDPWLAVVTWLGFNNSGTWLHKACLCTSQLQIWPPQQDSKLLQSFGSTSIEGYIVNRISEHVVEWSRNVRLCSRCLFPATKPHHSNTHTQRSVLFYSRVLATPWMYSLHLSLSSVILIDSSTDSPVHVLMLSIQAEHGLPRLREPGIVPCIISFSSQLPCFLMVWP